MGFLGGAEFVSFLMSLIGGLIVFFATFPIANDSLRRKIFNTKNRKIRAANKALVKSVRAMLTTGQSVNESYERLAKTIAKESGVTTNEIFTLEETLTIIQRQANSDVKLTQEDKMYIGSRINLELDENLDSGFREPVRLPKTILTWAQTVEDDDTIANDKTDNLLGTYFAILFSLTFALLVGLLVYTASAGNGEVLLILVCVVQSVVCISSFVSMIRPGEKGINFYRKIAYTNIFVLCLALLNIILAVL